MQVRFPCESLPDEPSQARLLGVYPQRQDGLFMQRVKAPGGAITLEQWRGLAALAVRYTPDEPLHVTTRQNIELHGVCKEDLPGLQRSIASLGLTGVAACGDSVRNITVCARNGCCPDTWDVGELVRAIRAAVETLSWRENLPRKFKISVSGCPQACGRPWINDVGLVANHDGSFRVILAGSLGAKPDLGLLMHDSLRPSDVVALVVAVLRLFHAEGDRANRGRARLRHVRQRLGEDAFRSCVDELLRQEKQRGAWPTPALRRVEARGPICERLGLPLGDIAPDMVSEMVEAVGAIGGEVRLGVSHDLLIFAHGKPAFGPGWAALRGENAVVACPGVTWCTRGLVDSRSAAARIRSALPGDCDLLVGVTGCPNNCSQAATADIGLIGRVLRRDGQERIEGFRLMAGGGKGETPLLAEELHPGLPGETVHEAVAWLAEQYRHAKGTHGMSIADFVASSGIALRDELEKRYGSVNTT
jgi:sulfite reductase (ferredoxin)